MPKGNSVPCELCSSNIVVGLLYEFEPDIFICDECRDKLVKIEGFWFDGHAVEQGLHPTSETLPDLQGDSTPKPLVSPQGES